MQFLIRKAIGQDIDSILKLFQKEDSYNYKNLPQLFKKPEEIERTREQIIIIVNNKEKYLFVAEKDRKLVGFIHYGLGETLAGAVVKEGLFVFIYSFFVEEAFKGQGIEHELISNVNNFARQENITLVQTNLWSFDKEGILLYKKSGYTIVTHKMILQLN